MRRYFPVPSMFYNNKSFIRPTLTTTTVSRSIASSSVDHWQSFLSNRRSAREPRQSDTVSRRYDAPTEGEVYANSGMNLAQIDVWGFDYDYTIANWQKHTGGVIYDLGLQALLRRGYPTELASLKGKFDASFVIRGLAYDRQTGFLLKLDQFGQIQLDSVYLGKRPVPVEEVISRYNGHTRLSRDYMSLNLDVLSDMFSLPEACLLADVTHFFETQGICFHPYHLYQDVSSVIDTIHQTQCLHQLIMKDLPAHVDVDPQLGVFFERLRNGGKKVFLLSNSGFDFINAGMTHLLSSFLKDRKMKSWMELFDIIIVDAKKPTWYSKASKFRRLDTQTGALSISPISKFAPGEVYSHGSLEEFHNLLGIKGDQVLYVGDQIYSDLLIPQKMAIWKTAAIINEVAHDVEVSRTSEYQNLINELLKTEVMLEEAQFLQFGDTDIEAAKIIQELMEHRNHIRQNLKTIFNPHFGSVFRTYEERSLFFFNICRLADLYTASLTNFLNYPLNFAFQVKRTAYAHENPLPLPI